MRSLARSPGFALVAILTVALGIASVTAVYSVTRAVVLRPLPFQPEESLVWIWSTRPDRDRAFFSVPHFLDLKQANATTADLAAITPLGINISGLGEPERVSGWRVTPNLFPLLGTQPHLGRMPGLADDTPTAPAVATLGHGYWLRRFGGDPAVVGRTVALNGTPHMIVGVLPPTFLMPTLESDIIIAQPLATDPRRSDRSFNFLRAIARLKPGVTRAEAQAEFTALTQRLVQQHPDTDGAMTPPRLVPLRQEVIAGYDHSLFLLLGAAGALLLIMGANLAGLLAARALARQRDAALRAALGASPGRLFRSFLAEGLLIAIAGGALGIVGCAFALPGLLALAPADLPRANTVSLDFHVLAAAIGCTLLTGLGIGLLPAFRLARTPPQDVLKGSSRSSSARSRPRGVLVGLQIALCTALLIGTGLLVRSLQKLLATKPGFTSRGVLTAQVSLAAPIRNPAEAVNLADAFVRGLRTLPGVTSVSLTHVLPLTGINTRSEFTRADRPAARQSDTLSAANRFVLENYFQTVGIPLRAGRDFRASDDATGPPVIIIDQLLADRFWPGDDVIGKAIRIPEGNSYRDMEIIGVVGATKNFSLEEIGTPTIYLPVRQATPALLSLFVGRMILVVHTAGDPLALKESAHRTLRTVRPDAAFILRSLDEAIAWARAPRVFNLRLLGFFSAAAVLLAAMGLYAITSQAVTARTREIGIRMALGADRGRITREVFTSGGCIVALGLVAGLLLAALLAPLGAAMLYGVRAFDPLTYVVIAGVLALVGALATWFPARRATKIDPIIALRAE